MFAKTFPKLFSFKTVNSHLIRQYFQHKRPSTSMYSKGTNSFMINQTLMKANNNSQLMYVFQKYKHEFSLVNYATILKQLSNSYSDNSQNEFDKTSIDELYNLLLKKLEGVNLQVEEARSLSNLYHYINKLKLGIGKEDFLLETLEKHCLIMIDSMNNQEFCLVIYNLGKNQKKELIVSLLDKIEERLELIPFDKLTRILYPLAMVSIHSKKADLILFDKIFKTKNIVKELDSQDYSSLFFYLGKFNNSIFTDQFYQKLDSGKSLVHGLNCEGLVNIIHSLTFIENHGMSREFFELCESKSIQLLKNFTNRQLSLLLRGYAYVNISIKQFYDRYIEEIKHREMSNEEIIIIIYHIASFHNMASSQIDEIINKFIATLGRNGSQNLTPQDIEKVFYSCYNLKSKGYNVLDDKLQRDFSSLIIKDIQKFTLKELGSICTMISILDEKYLSSVCYAIEEFILYFKNDPQEIDLKSISEIFYLTATQDSKIELNRLYIGKILRIGTDSAKIILSNQTTSKDLFYLRYYAKLVVSLSLIQMDDLDSQERFKLFKYIEEMIIENRNHLNNLHTDLLMETVLFNLIIGYYTLKFPINPEFKAILRDAILKLDLKTSRSSNLLFLKTKTDL